MTDSAEERALDAPETPEVEPDLVVPEGSGKPTSQGGTVDAKALAKEVAVLLRDDPEFIRGAIQVKDKRFNLLDPSNPELVQRVARALKEQDGDEDKAIRQVRLEVATDRILASDQESATEAGKPPKQSQKSLKDWASETLTEAGIPFGDPGYRAIVAEFQQGPFDEAEFKGAVRHLLAQRRAEKPVKPSAVVGETTGSRTSVTGSGLAESYVKDALALKDDGRIGLPEKRVAMRELKSKYRGKGVDVDSIDLTQVLPLMGLSSRREREDEFRKEVKGPAPRPNV